MELSIPYSVHNKVQRKVMYGKYKIEISNILKKLSEYKKVDIIDGAVCADHVHLCVSIPPKLSVAEFVGYLKGKSALMIFDKYPEMSSKWDRAFWVRGYYVTTIGNVNEEIIKNLYKRAGGRE